MASIRNIINYFRECYQNDSKAIYVLDFFGKKSILPVSISSWEIMDGKLPFFPISSEWGERMDKELALHSQEKALYAGTFFLKGKTSVLGREQKVFCPLYIHEVSLKFENEVYFVGLNMGSITINPSFLDFANSLSTNGKVTYDELEEALPKSRFGFKELIGIKDKLEELFPHIDTLSIDNLIKTEKLETDLKSVYKKRGKQDGSALICGMGIALIDRPSGSRGIINELKSISEFDDYSPIIKSVFQIGKQTNEQVAIREIISPASLSESQRRVFQSLKEHTCTLVVGPPGTGKSFTIAALAADLVSQGKSVLIASKNSQAGQVIVDKIEKDFGLKGIATKAFNQYYKQSLERKLNNIIHGISIQRSSLTGIKEKELEIKALQRDITALQRELDEREKQELEWGRFTYHYKKTLWNRWRKWRLEKKMDSGKEIWKAKEKWVTKRQLLRKKSKIHIRKKYNYHLYETLDNNRAKIQTLIHALGQDTGNQMQSYFNQIDFKVILNALPAWVCDAGTIHRNLPLIQGLFDVIIIDEASQCDIPSSIPLLQRGKKAVIVGDPKQLRHISFLSKKQQAALAIKHDLQALPHHQTNYRKNSLIDLVSSSLEQQRQVIFLNEHYRSLPDIISFSNKNFYEKNLKIMTSNPSTFNKEGLVLKRVDGKRNKKGENIEEAKAIIAQVQDIIRHDANLADNLHRSIGILSPFRAQVNLLKSQMREAIQTTDFKKHKILIGTPYQFQGEERDIMLISFAVDNDTHPSSFIYLNRPDVFNVSITRARSLQQVYYSINENMLPNNHILKTYLKEPTKKIHQAKDTGHIFDDNFMDEVTEFLRGMELECVLEVHSIAGIVVDIVVVNNGNTFAIDLIGHPGEYEGLFPLENNNMLERLGIETLPLPYRTWRNNRKKCERKIRQFLAH